MEVFETFGLQLSSVHKIPLFAMPVQAGHPITADSRVESEIDLNDFLIAHPAASFFAHVRGNNMNECGIADGDILVVDTSIHPVDGKIVVVSINNDLTVKLYRDFDGIVTLQTDNERYVPLKIEPYMEFKIVGIVTKVIHSL